MVSVSNDLEGMQAEHIDLQFPDEINSGNFGVQGVSFLFLVWLSFFDISMRPIFATLSDIVTCSPTGDIDAAK